MGHRWPCTRVVESDYSPTILFEWLWRIDNLSETSSWVVTMISGKLRETWLTNQSVQILYMSNSQWNWTNINKLFFIFVLSTCEPYSFPQLRTSASSLLILLSHRKRQHAKKDTSGRSPGWLFWSSLKILKAASPHNIRAVTLTTFSFPCCFDTHSHFNDCHDEIIYQCYHGYLTVHRNDSSIVR